MRLFKYDEIRYWNQRKNPNSALKEETDYHIAFVKNHISGCHSVLDVGCGVGRIFPAFEDVDEVTGFDISSRYQKRVMDASKQFDFRFQLIIDKTVGKLPFETNSFDAVVCVSVLMHQRPCNVVSMIRELCRVSRDKAVIVSFMDMDKDFVRVFDNDGGGDVHVFNYDYDSLFGLLGCTVPVFKYQADEKQVYSIISTNVEER